MRPLLLLLAASTPALTAAEPDVAMAKGVPVKKAAAHMTVPEGFSVDLIAGEPDVVQPIAMCFDARGRLWVAEGMTYPERAPDGEGKDRILIFEDTDGNGTYESRKTFADGLNLVSGIETGNGGLYVGAPPYLLFLPDRDGDDLAEEPEILLDGWGYQDTHETLNSFVWGPDGWLYGCHGVFTHSRVGKPGTPDDQRVPINAGVWRYHPGKERFEVFAHGTSNPWGLDFNDYGEAFVEACVIPHLWHIIPGGYYQRQAGSHFNPHLYDPIETIADHRHWVGDIADHAHWGHENAIPKNVSEAGGGHAHSGFAICLSDSFPAEMRGSALFFNIHGHRLNRDVLVKNGSGYTGKHAPDLLLSNDSWFLGVAIESGPDGAMYFTDWHDETSCHRTDPLRWNRGNGRLFRLRHGEVNPWKGDLAKSTDLELAKLQAGRDEWQLRTGRRLLQERTATGELAPEAVTSLLETMQRHPDATRRLRALWTLGACGLLDRARLPLQDADEHVRAWAIRLAAQENIRLHRADWLKIIAREDSPVVLLSLCSALPRLSRENSQDVAAWIAPKMRADDPNLTRMFWAGFEPQVPGNETRAVTVALSCPDERLLTWTARRMDSPAALVAALENPQGRTTRLLEAMLVRAEHRPEEKLTADQVAVVSRLADAGEKAAVALIERNGGAEAVKRLWTRLEDRGTEIPARLEALKLLIPEFQAADEDRLAQLTEEPALRVPVITARPALLEHALVGDRIAGFTPEEKAAVSRLAAAEGKTVRLLEWLAAAKLKPKEVPADAVARLRDTQDAALLEEIARHWGDGSEDRHAKITAWKEKLTPELLQAAEPARGRAVFDRTCAACHKLFGEGGAIGPELTGGERGSVDHWLDNILDPNALIGEGYALHKIEKQDGSTVTAMLAGESGDDLVLHMVGVETRIPKKDVKSNTALGVSMMPEGLLDPLSEQEVADLFRYLMAPAQVEK